MTRWANDATEFVVRLSKQKNRDGSYSHVCHVPSPILRRLGNPNTVRFYKDGNEIVLDVDTKQR